VVPVFFRVRGDQKNQAHRAHDFSKRLCMSLVIHRGMPGIQPYGGGIYTRDIRLTPTGSSGI
jgi:hypothetical protein